MEMPRTSARYSASSTALARSGRTIPMTSFIGRHRVGPQAKRPWPDVQKLRRPLRHAQHDLPLAVAGLQALVGRRHLLERADVDDERLDLPPLEQQGHLLQA